MKRLIYRFYFMLNDIKVNLINAYSLFFRKTAPIFLYHRICDIKKDPVMLAVSPSTFENQLMRMKEKYDLIPLYELSQRILKGNLNGREASITFDDGHRDNLIYALPILEKHKVPATIFINTIALGQKSTFAWDKEYDADERSTFLNESEIKMLSENPLVEIGGHTHSHVRLKDLFPKDQKEEITKNKMILENIIGKNIRLFAYPFGNIFDFNKTSENAVEDAGFEFAFSNTQLLAKTGDHRYSIPRINIRETTKNL